MKGATVTLLAVIGILSSSIALAQPPLIDYYGACWETGAFPPSNFNDYFFMVGYVDGMDTSILSWNPAVNEYTIYLTDFQSQGQIDEGGGNLHVYYDNGRVLVYEDPARNGNFGVGTPPNATSPWSFVDGTIYLSGVFNQFQMYYNTDFQMGSYDGYFDFMGGTHLGQLGNQIHGYIFAGTMGPTMGPVPQGYDLWADGEISLVVTPVRPSTWGAIKSQYR